MCQTQHKKLTAALAVTENISVKSLDCVEPMGLNMEIMKAQTQDA
jgi:hypothetical protein